MADDITIVVNAQDNFSGVLGNFGNIMTGIKSAIDLAGDAFRFFKDYALQGLDAIATYERLTATLSTLSAVQALQAGTADNMTDALAQTSGQAQELLDWMQQLAIKSPFTLEGVANAFRTAEAYGFTAEEAQRLTQAMIDFAAGSGATEGTMSQIALALGQIQAKGKLAGQEVLQLVNAGLPVTQILAEAFGVTTAEIEKMREDGLIPADEAIKAITEYLETNFAGAAERQANTWAGLQGTFADIKQMGLREFFGGMFDVLQPLAIELSNFLQTEGLDKLGEWGTKLGELTTKFIDFISKIQDVGVSNFDWGKFFEDALISGVDNIDWNAVGLKINSVFQEKLSTNILSTETKSVLGKAFTDLLAGGFGYIDWDSLKTDFWEGVSQVVSLQFGGLSLDRAMWRQIGRDLVDGIKTGFSDGIGGLFENAQQFWTDYILYVKHILGISSPSTIFRQIGVDIVQGLIGGFTATWSNLLTIANNALGDFLDLFGIDLGSLLGSGASGLGTAGGGTGTTGGGTGGGTSGQVVNNYFYGTVYIGSSLDDANYDCPSPNPLVAASGNQLVATGF